MSTSTSASRQRRRRRAPGGPGNGRCFNIFDRHLIARTGHHFDFCHAIARNLIQRGFTVRGCGHQASQAAVAAEFARLGADYVRVFSNLPHGSRQRVPLTHRDIQAIADRTAAEMAGVVRADFSLFPTLTPHCLLALASLEAPSRSARLLHVEPSASPSGALTWKLACRKVRRRRLKVTIGSIDPLITESLRAAGGDLPIWDMPIPLDGRFKAAYSSEAKTIGFFGHQRRERGLDLLPSLVGKLLESGYRVVLHDTAGHFGAGDVRPRLRLLTFVEDLSAEITFCDVVVCPMEASHYGIDIRASCGMPWPAVCRSYCRRGRSPRSEFRVCAPRAATGNTASKAS